MLLLLGILKVLVSTIRIRVRYAGLIDTKQFVTTRQKATLEDGIHMGEGTIRPLGTVGLRNNQGNNLRLTACVSQMIKSMSLGSPGPDRSAWPRTRSRHVEYSCEVQDCSIHF